MRDGRFLGGPKCRHEGNITTALFTAAGRVHRKISDVCYDGMTDGPRAAQITSKRGQLY